MSLEFIKRLLYTPDLSAKRLFSYMELM